MNYLPTSQQSACYNFVLNPRSGSLAIDAKAGTGKTCTLREIANRLPGSGLATSFSRLTVRDLSNAMPGNWDAVGIHALGNQAIKKRLSFVKVDTQNNALFEIVKELLADEDGKWKILSDVCRLVKIAALYGIVPGHENFVLADTPKNWESLADTFDIDYSPLIYDTARKSLRKINDLALKGNITYTHMLTLPLFWNFPIKQYPKIIIDEAQDLNILQHLLIERALRPGGRVFIAGDPSQAIYAFSGALSDSFTSLTQRFNATIQPLTLSWRCPKAVIREAQLYVPLIEAVPNAIEGLVERHSSINVDALPRTIICRNNAPLMALALRLFVQGYSVEIAGKKDIKAGLKSIINRLAAGKNSDAMKSEEFLDRLDRWAHREVSRRPIRRPAVEDKVAALKALASHHSTLGKIRQHLDKLYIDLDSENRRPVEFHFSTIHKAKGREWDKIAFLDSHLLPSKWAKQPWEIQQENNLAYVAVTRARQELHYITSEK